MRFPILILTLACSVAATASAQTVTQFRAVLTPEAAIDARGRTPDTSQFAANFSGVANFTLTQPASGTPTLAYEILFSEVEFPEPGEPAEADGIVGNEALAIHIHNTAGVSHTAGTPHSLNIFGFPQPFDDDALVDRSNATVSGLWEDTDEVLPITPPGNKSLTSQLDDLFAGELYLILHTNTDGALAAGITLAGQLVQVPEPSTAVLAVIGLAGLVRRR